mmetsp:Transcript_25636/g.59729  ORF Transcript_25636/g.59729 Transcript_25636/m.59729 type:complete len:233 (+) Transcript_25636:180-878(+)|eukprot:CAMPEP_0178393626 /NCGR_PEP_ID=MMETSP0689_2-20121128/12284_1 /TAXON_ID=160604 /ORGANISM="Amphidinium massartii, Strain CS-259" /LENGTH=232 /DNA_ID=CAMNT_0020014223 /DNA_START=178 /DNA_END=876 /DNA_ORIENTATION=+
MYKEVRNLFDAEAKFGWAGQIRPDHCLALRDVSAALARMKLMRKHIKVCNSGVEEAKYRARPQQGARALSRKRQAFEFNLVPAEGGGQKLPPAGRLKHGKHAAIRNPSPRIETARIGALLASSSPSPGVAAARPSSPRLANQTTGGCHLRGAQRARSAPATAPKGVVSRGLSKQQLLRLPGSTSDALQLRRPTTASSSLGSTRMASKLREINQAHLEVRSNRTASVLRAALY